MASRGQAGRNWPVWIGVGGLVILTAVAAFATATLVRAAASASTTGATVRAALFANRELLTIALDEDASLRGYIFSLDPGMVRGLGLQRERFTQTRARLQDTLQQLDLPRASLDELSAVNSDWLRDVALPLIAIRHADVLRLQRTGKAALDHFRSISATLDFALQDRAATEDRRLIEALRSVLIWTFILIGVFTLALIVGLIRDNRIRARNEAQLQELADRDGLTGLFNRRALLTRLESEMGRASRSGSRLALAYLDLDEFKPINDRYGHTLGDAYLVETSRRLRDAVRDHDIIARLGGDEFVVLIDASSLHDVRMIVERISQSVAAPAMLEKHTVTGSVSIGVAVYPDDAINASSLLRAADSAMYEAKGDMRGSIHFAAITES